MQIYLVGGAVRDALLGRPVQDRDWVVVGALPQDMLTKGFKPVGKDFPVFLHPHSAEEYALARTERKTGRGYAGFSFHTAPDVTLEQDLARRDLTINAIAQSANGELIDPYGGVADLRAGVLRHVGPAFAEDPLRVLRVARFAARFADFKIASDTLELMRTLVRSGELDDLAAERRWQEIARGLMEAAPWRMLDTLEACGALGALLPEVPGPTAATLENGLAHSLSAYSAQRQLVQASLLRCVSQDAPLAVRWACLLRQLLCQGDEGAPPAAAQTAQALSMRLKTPNDCRDLAELFVREHRLLENPVGLSPQDIVAVLERCDAFRRPERFHLLMDCAACSSEADAEGFVKIWADALKATQGIDAAAIARSTAQRQEIPQRIRQARVEALQHPDLSAREP